MGWRGHLSVRPDDSRDRMGTSLLAGTQQISVMPIPRILGDSLASNQRGTLPATLLIRVPCRSAPGTGCRV